MNKKNYLIMAFGFGCFLGLSVPSAVKPLLLSGEKVFGVILAQDCALEVEYVKPPLVQRILHFTMRDPAFARLISIPSGKTIATSGIADFFGGNGQVVWAVKEEGRVWVGLDIVFSNVPVTKSACPTSNDHR